MAMWWEVFFYVYIESVAHSNNVGIICSGNLYMEHSFPSSIPASHNLFTEEQPD